MPGGGTRTFFEPDHYEASLHQAQIEAVIVPRGKFRASLTWAALHHLQVLRCEEASPRLAYLQLAPSLAFVTFPGGFEPLPVWRGREMQPGDIMFHSRGERLHQSTSGPSVWNVIAMDPAQLERYGQALSGKPFSWPPEGRVLQLSPHLAARLRRLHSQIYRLAQTKSKMLSHSEVARAIEQGLIQGLVTCLTIIIYGICLELGERLEIPGVHSFVSTAEAIIGRPLTPMSYAGVARRTARRCAVGVYYC